MTTGATACSPVQDAVFDALNVSSFTTLSSGGFFTDVPQGTPFPYAWLTFNQPMEEPLDTFGTFGSTVHLELHVYSTYEGDDQCLDILSEAIRLLHHVTLTPSGWTVPLMQRIQHDIVVEEYNGNPLRHGIARIDVIAFKD